MIQVLLVDNDVQLCETLAQYLNTLPDMTVVGVAYDGEQALQQIEALLPDIVVLDITMPKLDGMAVLETLNMLQLEKMPRVIILSALGREQIIQRFMELGAQYFLVKPFDIAVLAERIREFTTPNTLPYLTTSTQKNTNSCSVDEEKTITRLLNEMGIPSHFKGYKYLRDAVLMVLHDDLLLMGSLTNTLYPRLAKKYSATPSGVEAAIRNSIITCWEVGNRDFITSLVGNAGAHRKTFPTNSIVIAKLADEVRLARVSVPS